MATVIGLNDAKARKLWSTELHVAVARESYWTRKLMGKGTESPYPVQLKTDLERDSGDQISYDLSIQLSGMPFEGDQKAEGGGRKLDFYTDKVYIDQARYPVSCGGRMTRKRTVHDMRKVGMNRLKDYWSRFYDEQFFMYASGARGINPDYIAPIGYTGRANNAFHTPDAEHQMYGDGTSKATLTSAGVMTKTVIERAVTKAQSEGGGSTEFAEMQPIRIAGGEHFVVLMHTFQMHSLRTSTSSGDWQDIQKAAAAAEGAKNPIFTGNGGMINNAILHSHKAVVRFNDYGAGSNLAAARALFLGRQALVLAFGSPGSGLRMEWSEVSLDHGNDLEICAGGIFGIKASTFNNKRFGLIAIDTYAANPN